MNDTTYRVGIDVGGTFTDLSLWSPSGGLQTFKTPSTPHDPSVAVLHGLELMARAEGISTRALARRTGFIVHGTTVTTNAVLTRTGARCGLITTAGVRDALEMRRGIREAQYDNRYRNVVPLVPRRRRLSVGGRLDFRGDEVTALDPGEVKAAAERLAADGVGSVAICFMNAFANPAHEQAAAEVVRAALPEAYVTVSSEVLPTIRFYDRVSTVALDAYVGPVLQRYLGHLTCRLDGVGFEGVLLIMQSNGGVAAPELTARRPASTLLSGPAAGPRAAATYARLAAGEGVTDADCVVMDMGGTSFDASLVRGGAATMNSTGAIDRLRIALPMLDITTVGAGGGSIGWLDAGGLLRMGPASAGAAPGPACYGRGGEAPTCTDADLVLGYLDPGFFAGGEIHLDTGRARAAIRACVAEPLGLTVEEAAAGMYRVINTNMAHGVREITVKRGLDPREFPLVVAGGAGGVHACMIADELEMPTLLVPPTASVLCATGMLLCDLQHDFVRSLVSPLETIDLEALRRVTGEMIEQGARLLAEEGAERAEHQVALDLRYLQQYHEVSVPISSDTLVAGDFAAMAEAFHEMHDRLYGYSLRAEGAALELINVRVRSLGRAAPPSLPRPPPGGPDPARALKGRRRAYVPEAGAFAEVPVYDGHALRAGNRVEGPALLERTDTTLFVSARYEAEVDAYGSVMLRRRAGGATR